MSNGLAWTIINTILSLALSLILVHKLLNWFDNFNRLERFGMGLMAGSVLLTIPALWLYGPTPFDQWTTALLRLGAVVYFVGRLSRHRRHWIRNRAMIEAARNHSATGERPQI